MIFARKRRHLERYIEIGKVLAKHGWENFLARLGLAETFRLRRRAAGAPPGPEQVREALEELGPTFIKLGQLLSTRADIIPQEYIVELEKLQDRVPPFPFSMVREVIEEEFASSLESVFENFDPSPLAAASLGQTHLATLANNIEVVVKIQRPEIKKMIDTDLEIIAGIARFLEQHFEQAKGYNLIDLVDEFSITINQELDYTREGRNGDRLRENFEGEDYVRFAATQWEFTTQKVLTIERLDGVKITKIEEIDRLGYDRKQIAKNLSQSFLKMIFIDGLFHGDPHPGNVIVLENNVIGLIDYGQVGRLDPELKTKTTRLLAAYVQEDPIGFSDILLEMGTTPPDFDRQAFYREIDKLLRQYFGAQLREIEMSEILRRSFNITANMRVKLPSSLALLVKAMLGVESADRLLDPEYDFAEEAKPFIIKSFQNEFSYSRLREQILQSLLAWKYLILELPQRTSDVLDKMTQDRFKVVFKHEGLEKPIQDIDRSANRLSFALIASATIIGSSLILSAEVGPIWRGYPLLGVIGFGLSFIFAIWLMISIIRAGKMW